MSLIIGSHVGYGKDKQLIGSIEEAISYGANTFMFYTGAPQNTMRSSISTSLVESAFSLMDRVGIDIGNVIVHAPYIVNLANNEKEDSYRFAIDFLKSELDRCSLLGMKYLVLHPGSFVNLDVARGIENIANALNLVLGGTSVVILLETMAGKGTEIGRSFEEIAKIISLVKYPNIGVCMDTCHMHDAGYDVSDFDGLLAKFDEVVGFSYLKCIHINDSKNVCGASKDRHENFGFGYIGFDNLIKIVYHPLLVDVPKILESPYVDKKFAPYKYEIDMIKSRVFNPNLLEEVKNV
jgi:deoxyribonuclease-4